MGRLIAVPPILTEYLSTSLNKDNGFTGTVWVYDVEQSGSEVISLYCESALSQLFRASLSIRRRVRRPLHSLCRLYTIYRRINYISIE